MRKQFVKTIEDVVAQDERLVVLLGDIGVFGFRNVFQKYPERIFNIGILEQAMTSLAAGIAKEHLIPVIHTISSFAIERCFEQIKVDFCYQGLGGNIVSVGSTFDYSALGCTHHSYSDIALIRSLSGTQIIYPGMPNEFDILFKQTYQNDRLTYFRLSENQHFQELSEHLIQFGKGIHIDSGDDITVVVTGPQLKNVVNAGKILRGKDIHLDILYIHTIKPIDTKLLKESAIRTKKVLTVEEYSVIGGLADEVARTLESLPEVQLFRKGIMNKFMTTYCSYKQACEEVGLTLDSIIDEISRIVKNE